MQKNSFWLLALVVLTLGCGKFERLRKKGTDEEKYQAALVYYKKGSWDKAVLLFEELKPILKGSDQQEIATFYEAYCNYNLEQYEVAGFQFKRFYEVFGRSDYAEESLYMSAYSAYKASMPFYLDQSSTLSAMDAMQGFVNAYPASQRVEEASKIIKASRVKLEKKAYERAKLYYKTSPANLQNFRSAVFAVNNFEKDFPESDYIEELQFLRLQAQHDFAVNSLETKQRERYTEVLKLHEKFNEKYPQSNYQKRIVKLFEASNKALDKINETEQLAKAAKAATGAKLGGAN